ncbi:MAG: hypothetical protein ACHQEA_03365 [Gaiellales bacterium]
MIYCVVPRELEAELLEQLADAYRDNPDVCVIVDRRDGRVNDRRRGAAAVHDDRRQTRNRRRQRALGTFPRTEAFA